MTVMLSHFAGMRTASRAARQAILFDNERIDGRPNVSGRNESAPRKQWKRN
jgi:hypothetical protein